MDSLVGARAVLVAAPVVVPFKASAGEFTFDQMTFSNSWEQKRSTISRSHDHDTVDLLVLINGINLVNEHTEQEHH